MSVMPSSEITGALLSFCVGVRQFQHVFWWFKSFPAISITVAVYVFPMRRHGCGSSCDHELTLHQSKVKM